MCYNWLFDYVVLFGDVLAYFFSEIFVETLRKNINSLSKMHLNNLRVFSFPIKFEIYFSKLLSHIRKIFTISSQKKIQVGRTT